MKTLLTIGLMTSMLAAHGVTLPKDEERLRELAVVPKVTLTFNFYVSDSAMLEDLTEDGTLEDWIEQARKKLKSEPNDLQTQLQLGRLLDDTFDTNATKVAYEKAAVMGRQRLEQRPNDGMNLTLLAQAVWGLDNETEAERLYRRATLVASNDWHCWLGLGDFLHHQATSSLRPNSYKKESVNWPPRTTFDDERSAPVPSPEQMDRAVKLCHDASICFQRAYEIAPREFEVLVRYGFYRYDSNWLAAVVQRYQAEKLPSVEEYVPDSFNVSGVSQDFERALEVRPQSYKLVYWLAWLEWFSAMQEAQRSGSTRLPTLEKLPEKSRQAIEDYLQRLRAFSDGPNKKVAAAALTWGYVIKLQFGEPLGFSPELLRAVEYDPTNEHAWNLLIGCAMDKVAPEKLTELCERRLKTKKNALNHLILAKALYKQKRFQEATKQTDAAIKLEPEYVPALLMRGALLLRLGKGGGGKKELNLTLKKAAELIKQSTNPESRDWWLVYALNGAIYSAINGNSQNAKAWLAMCQNAFPEDARVKEIQNALP